MILANTNTTTRIAAPVAATLLAAGAIGVTHTLTHENPRAHGPATPSAIATPRSASPFTAPKLLQASSLTSQRRALHPVTVSAHPFGPGRVIPFTRRAGAHSTPSQRAPGGFSYLGVPTTPAHHQASPPPPQAQTERPGGGGEFSP